MKLILFSDTHLGRKNFKVNERENDFENAFSQVIDYALKNGDVVIHCGDIFDIGEPSIRTLLFVINELKKLKAKEIPFFTIAGSHDVGVDGTFLKILHNLELLINVSDKKYYLANEDKIIVKGERRKNIYVCGLRGKQSRVEEILERMQFELPKDSFNIFLLHHIISDIAPLFSTIKKSSLPKGFDLYVSGHWHGLFETDVGNKKLIYPGSTERCDFREMKNGNNGFILYNTENNSYKFLKLNNRKSEIIEVDCNDLSEDEVKDKLLSYIKQGDNKMLFFVLKGKLKSGTKSSINRREIYTAAKSNGYLFCKIYTGELINPDENQISLQKKSISEVEKEFFKNKGFNGSEIKIALTLLNDLGKDYKPNEFDNKLIDIIKYLEHELL